jgi:hypothetical protein
MSDILFTSEAHKARFLTAIQEIDKVYAGRLDPEYGAALYILTSSSGTWEKASSYVSRYRIDFEEMFNEVDFSGGYSVLIKLASNLFNGNTHIDPLEFLRLDDHNFDLALNAIKIRRYGLKVDDFR